MIRNPKHNLKQTANCIPPAANGCYWIIRVKCEEIKYEVKNVQKQED